MILTGKYKVSQKEAESGVGVGKLSGKEIPPRSHRTSHEAKSWPHLSEIYTWVFPGFFTHLLGLNLPSRCANGRPYQDVPLRGMEEWEGWGVPWPQFCCGEGGKEGW